MNLKDIAAIAGKPGLYKVLKPSRTGVIVETLEAKPKKTIVSASQRISILKEISMYVTGQAEESVPLEEVFASVKEKFGTEKLDVDTKSEESLEDFIFAVLPNWDSDRIYTSDIKKLVTWYNKLVEFYPESLEDKKEDKEASEKAAE
ncbi:DUF5606 domain-containing protein [Flammeovirga yaeyamensis]|uniref:DUF5606 domain-containing protein n=1 Tax=Flammeovirga yaeyamensis TaxID=367791 RepID=A0AAX1N3V0_9BACT|nr:DUF5606 domain-containing protein [Flammeovirga yaeyamensis]MBB3700591.1 hypothetical protein [Flammeovirga yaeyamensis]NMF37707.1 DUF5606 domain-containing protein [Flammeovirga yaeyamensis]QWG02016.1 DUF5606 domain-containing protein [Flammeovirga yaeyamensis]